MFHRLNVVKLFACVLVKISRIKLVDKFKEKYILNEFSFYHILPCCIKIRNVLIHQADRVGGLEQQGYWKRFLTSLCELLDCRFFSFLLKVVSFLGVFVLLLLLLFCFVFFFSKCSQCRRLQ